MSVSTEGQGELAIQAPGSDTTAVILGSDLTLRRVGAAVQQDEVVTAMVILKHSHGRRTLATPARRRVLQGARKKHNLLTLDLDNKVVIPTTTTITIIIVITVIIIIIA